MYRQISKYLWQNGFRSHHVQTKAQFGVQCPLPALKHAQAETALKWQNDLWSLTCTPWQTLNSLTSSPTAMCLFPIPGRKNLCRVRTASVANAIWRSHPRLHNRDVSSDLALYTPKRSISLLSAEDFKNGISEILDQGKRPRLEALNGPLLPRQKVSDLWPSGPDENVLQLIVVPGILLVFYD